MIEDLYIGTIRRCTSYIDSSRSVVELIGNMRIVHSSTRYDSYTSEVYDENVVLLRTANDGYVDVRTIDDTLELKLNNINKTDAISPIGKILDTTPKWVDQLYVDEDSLECLNTICKPLSKSIKLNHNL